MDIDSVAAFATIIGTVVAVIGYFQARRRRGLKQPPAAAPHIEATLAKRTYASCQRMNRVLELINMGRKHDLVTPAHFAERLKMERAGEFERILEGAIEPTFELLDTFADLTGANNGWLKFGRGEPFLSEELNDSYPDHCLSRIRELSPKQTYVIRCRDVYGRSGFLLRLSDLKFVVFKRTWHISGEVGGTGQRQLVSFYHAMRKLSLGTAEGYGYPGGRMFDQPTFDRLLAGTIYPGSVIQPHENPWWDDFTDLDHRYFGAEHYGLNYGQEFLVAQNIVRMRLKDDLRTVH